MNLTDPPQLRSFLAKYGAKADKALGQHFLCSDPVVDRIVARVEEVAGILEIGPGPGILTSKLAAWDRKLTALELDPRMVQALKDSAPYADVLQVDALQANFIELLAALPEPRGIVGNLPYYITSPLLEKIAEARQSYSKAVLMVQKEVANRIGAKPGDGDRGSLSVYLQAFFEIEIIVQVPQTAFDPPPKVKSTVIEMRPRVPAEGVGEDLFRLVRLGFGQPRKTLLNNLVAGLMLDRERAAAVIDAIGLRPDIRPHILAEDEWIRLKFALK